MGKETQVTGRQDVNAHEDESTTVQGGKTASPKTEQHAETKVDPSAPGETGTTPGTNGK